MKKKLPQFRTLDELVAFWEEHDFTDYQDQMEEVDLDEALPHWIPDTIAQKDHRTPTITLDGILRDIHAMQENLLVFERKYGVPSEIFYEAYQHGEEPADSAWVLDWSQWAAIYEILQDRRAQYAKAVRQLFADASIDSFSQLIERTTRREPITVAG